MQRLLGLAILLAVPRLLMLLRLYHVLAPVLADDVAARAMAMATIRPLVAVGAAFFLLLVPWISRKRPRLDPTDLRIHWILHGSRHCLDSNDIRNVPLVVGATWRQHPPAQREPSPTFCQAHRCPIEKMEGLCFRPHVHECRE